MKNTHTPFSRKGIGDKHGYLQAMMSNLYNAILSLIKYTQEIHLRNL